ncbi:uncharacterized protein LOC143147024 [Ptiloglossa arizonensis]|uniref:uncharacterized protein LOC143147024 n=1 Tax=Ptiloglossa arizonensis TaxID=3350558 RepID=UPI003FA16F78
MRPVINIDTKVGRAVDKQESLVIIWLIYSGSVKPRADAVFLGVATAMFRLPVQGDAVIWQIHTTFFSRVCQSRKDGLQGIDLYETARGRRSEENTNHESEQEMERSGCSGISMYFLLRFTLLI